MILGENEVGRRSDVLSVSGEGELTSIRDEH